MKKKTVKKERVTSEAIRKSKKMAKAIQGIEPTKISKVKNGGTLMVFHKS